MIFKEASYGGAYDIEDNMYFTKDDLLDFTDELIDTLQDKGIFVDLIDMYITDGNRLVIAVEDEDGNEIDTDEFIDMRKIHCPKDIYKYKNIFIKDILSQYNEFKSFNEDLDEIPIVDGLNFINKRRNGMPGIANINEFIDCLNAVGKDKFMVKETKVGSNLSLADLKDERMTLKKKGWKWYTKNIPGDFLTYYVFEKINKGENMKENLVENDLYQLKAEIEDEVKKYMISQGFEPDEVKDYSVVDIYFDSKERDTAIVEVRAELSYDGLSELGFKLNKIVADYDEDAYFEPVEPGITSAYIHNITPEKINECSKQIKEDYEDESNYINDLYEILIQAQVCIDKIKKNYSSDVYDIIKLGIEQTLDEFMAHDEDGWTIFAAMKEFNKSSKEDTDLDDKVDENLKESLSGYVLTDCAYCGQENRVKVNFPDSDKGFTTTYYNCKYCNKKNKLVDEMQESYDPYTELLLYDVDDKLGVTAPSHSGARIPYAKRHCINEINIPHNMRFKYYDTKVNLSKDEIVLNWLTQEPFSEEDFNLFIQEVRTAFNQIIQDIEYLKPFKVEVNVKDRDNTCAQNYTLAFNDDQE